MARTLVKLVLEVLRQTNLAQSEGLLEGRVGLLQEDLQRHLDASVLACKVLDLVRIREHYRRVTHGYLELLALGRSSLVPANIVKTLLHCRQLLGLLEKSILILGTERHGKRECLGTTMAPRTDSCGPW